MTEYFAGDKPVADIFSDHQKTLKLLDQRLETLDRSLRAYHCGLSAIALSLRKSKRLHRSVSERFSDVLK
ncbi:MAG: hypothetical protein ACK4VI_01280 [Alphaproteobacteria bacterium]